MKQTAVEWFIEKLPLIQKEGLRDEIEQAKEIEKEQIIYAHISGVQSISGKMRYHYNDAVEYYNETFKNETK